MAEGNRVDIRAWLGLDKASAKKTQDDIARAIHDAARQSDLSTAIQQQISAAAPGVRKAANQVLNVNQDINKAKSESNKLAAEAAKLTEQDLKFATQLKATKQEIVALGKREAELGEQAAKWREVEAKHAATVAAQAERAAKARREASDVGRYVGSGNLAIRRLRLEGKPEQARAKDKALQPFREEQHRLTGIARDEEARLSVLTQQAKSRAAVYKDIESEIVAVRKRSGAAAGEVTKIETAMGKNRATLVSHTEKIRQADDAHDRVIRRKIESLKQLEQIESKRASSGGGGGFGHGYRNASAFGDLFRSVPGSVGGPFGAVLGPLALADMVSYGEALTTAAQSLALIPAAATAAGAAIGTLTIGMIGFEDTIKAINDPKKFLETIQHLSPAAQQAALEIQSLVQGPLGELKKMVQENLFKGVAPQLHGLAQEFGPTLSQLTGGVATAINHMFSNLTGALVANKGGIVEIVNNIVAGFQKLEPAVKPFVDALVTITRVGSGFLPSLAGSITDMANAFNNFIQKAAQDGSLQNFIQKGIDGVKVLGQAALELGTKLFDLFGNQSPQQMKENIDNIVSSMVTLATVVQQVAHFINDWRDVLLTVGALFLGGKFIGGILGGLDKIMKLLGAEAGITGLLKGLGPAATTAGAEMAAGLAPATAAAGKLSTALKGIGAFSAALAGSFGADKAFGWLDKTFGTDIFEKFGEIPGSGTWIMHQLFGDDKKQGGPDSPSQSFMDHHKDIDVPGMASPPSSGDSTNYWWQNGDYKDKPVPDITKYMPQLSTQLPPGMQPFPGVQIAPGAMAPAAPTAGALYPGSPGVTPQIQYGTSGAPYEKPSLGYRKVDPKELSDGAINVQKAAIDLGEANMELDQVMKNGAKSQKEKLDAQIAQAEKQKAFDDAQLDYHKAAIGKWEKIDANLAVFGEIGAHLDKDLGLSRGLPGLADNLVKFVAGLATAPMMGQLAQVASQGDGSYGLLGMAFGGYGHQGVGPQSFTNQNVGTPGNINPWVPASAWGPPAGSPTGGPPNSYWWAPGAQTVNKQAGFSGMYTGVPASDTSKSGLAQYGGIPGAPSGQGQDILAYMNGVLTNFNAKNGTSLKVTADYPGGPTGHPDDGGDHSARRALDISGSPDQMNAFAAYIANDPQLRAATRQLIHNPGGAGGPFTPDMNIIGGHLTNGFQTYGGGEQGMGGHLDHDHWALQDIPNGADQASTSLTNLANAADKTTSSITGGLFGAGAGGPQQAPPSAYKGQDAALAAALKGKGFTDSQITGLTALNGVETGKWSHPESIMGFTNQQTGPGIDAHVAGFKNMWDRRQQGGAVPPMGAPGSGQDAQGNVIDPSAFAQWLLKLEGYSSTTDWAGNKYAPGQFMSDDAYAKSVTDAYQPGLPSGGGQGLPIPAGPKMDFGGGQGSIFGPGGQTPAAKAPGGSLFGPGATSPGYQPQQQPEQKQGWQPNSDGGIGIGGGLLGAGIQAAMSAAGTAGAPFGGAAASAAAQMAMQLTNRTIKYGGQVAGIAAEGLMDTFMPSDPDTGKNPLKDSWLWRALGAAAGAAPAIGDGGAGLLDKAALKKMQDQKGQGGQNGDQQPNGQSGPMVNIENLNQADGQSGKSLGQDIAHQALQIQAYNAGQPR